MSEKNSPIIVTQKKKPVMRPSRPETTELNSPGIKPITSPPANRPSTMRNLAPWKGFNPGKLS